jgi:type IV pilus biogenesis protein CpaD/CtpE
MQRSLTGMPRASVLLLAAALLLGGCASLEPWVKPYEREHLADPIMALSPNPVSATYLDHVFESREGSKGATGAVGGGCGCN